MHVRRCVFFAMTLLVSCALAELPLHQKPVAIDLNGPCGGRLNGESWKSSEIPGKISIVYYVDPDESEMNASLFEALRAEKFPMDKVRSIAVINMKATWLPSAVLSMALGRKQKRYPATLYVKDNCKTLAGTWGLADHSSDVVLFNQSGEVVFSKDGKLTDAHIKQVIALVWSMLDEEPEHAAQ
jgi:uncharacterized protein